MKKTKIEAFEHFNNKSAIDSYTRMYGSPDFKNGYPANKQRLAIIMTLLDKIKPKNISDAGCGAGMPIIEMLKMGYDVTGYDKSQNMIERAKTNLINNGFDPDKVCIGNFEDPDHIKDQSFDCITGMGAFYYSRDILKTLLNQKKKLRKGGHLIFSLRNKLFDLVTLNEYTQEFLGELFGIDKYDEKIQKIFFDQFSNINKVKKKFKNLDESGVFSTVHNPLTVNDELLEPLGLLFRKTYFFHFHSLPPIFEHIIPEQFRLDSWKMENPTDWKGNFLSSGFIVHCIKH